MSGIEVDEGSGPFARMLGGLVQANVTADPGKQRLLDGARGVVDVVVSDTGEEVRMRFGEAGLLVGPAAVTGTDRADLRLTGSADVIMGLSTVPLRFGLPDLLSARGRGVAGRVATGPLGRVLGLAGGLVVDGLPRSAPLLRTTISLLSVL